jgi:hypothetical protein
VYHPTGENTYTVPCGGQERTLWFLVLGVDISPLTKTPNFLWERIELIGLIKLIDNFNFDNLYNKPECHVVSRAFLTFKNTTAVIRLLFKFKIVWSLSLVN